ncbi:hypothetical protein SZN_29140 [Streptomyces zinciresistens K42]|uniref:Uncharacterized protein n=1 Tax=Streptomyces zinciresistens K42 TaxID=700597 RepID=G2GJY5_9ACTN|nr:DUF6183 family protein [Streptomyces zinciresistens]EGX56187.1 hypothetical protein SZN_29140 [Streptomyces zinciresistens K42]
MADRIQKIVTKLPGLKSVTDVWKTADRSLERGDAAFVTDLAIALAGADVSDAGRTWQYRSVFDYLLRLMATTPGPGNVAQTLRLVSSAEVYGRKLDRYTASLLASSQPAEELAVAFTGHATEELRACLVHELVLRGVDVTGTPGIAGWATSPHWSHHPLRRLPLALAEVEGQPDLPSCNARGGSHSMPYGPLANREVRGDGRAQVPSAEETTTEAVTKGIGAAVTNWADESNGRIEARTFDLAASLAVESVPSTLMALGLKCLEGAGTKKTSLSVAACPPEHAWRVLFAAASTGGAYNSGARGAYGRLAAWQSMAGLSGTAYDSPAEEVEARARACAWYAFSANTKWFERVAWDIGLVAVSPDSRQLAMLAATDTD